MKKAANNAASPILPHTSVDRLLAESSTRCTICPSISKVTSTIAKRPLATIRYDNPAGSPLPHASEVPQPHAERDQHGRSEDRDRQTHFHAIRRSGGIRVESARGAHTSRDEGSEMLDLFVNLDWSIPAVAKKFDLSQATLLRRVYEATGIRSKQEAVKLHQEGLWPPPKKPGRRKA